MKRHWILYIIFMSLCFSCCKSNSSVKEVFVKGAEFDFSEALNTNSETVTIKNFYISKYKITRREYEAFLKETGYAEYTSDSMEYSFDVTMPEPECPAMFVSFYDACEYCNYLSEKNNLKKVYDLSDLSNIKRDKTANGFRLPSKNEWFYALLGGTKYSKTIWWEKMSYTDYMDIDHSFTSHAPVGRLKPNPLKLYDILGNGLEWTDTEIYKESFNDNEKCAFVAGPGVPGYTISEFENCTEFLTDSYKTEPCGSMDTRYFYIGFRVARNAE